MKVNGRRIVVGLDHSPESIAAMRWAATFARAGADELHVVHAYAQQLAPSGERLMEVLRANEARRATARSVTAAAVRLLRAGRPDLNIDGSAVIGDPIAVLSGQSVSADLIVIGGASRSTESFRGPGRSIGWRIAIRSACPVVVVPNGPAPKEHAPVAVLLNSPTFSPDTLELAFVAAQAYDTSVLIIAPWALGVEAQTPGRNAALTGEGAPRKALDDALLSWRERYPAVLATVQPRQTCGHAAMHSLQHTALLIMVVLDPVIDPVLQADARLALRHPRCPVVIVPSTSSPCQSVPGIPAAHATAV